MIPIYDRFTIGLPMMEDIVAKEVYHCLNEHSEGGEVYFNTLDSALKNNEVLVSSYINYFTIKEGCFNLIVSGEIAECVERCISKGFIFDNVFLVKVNGGLRKEGIVNVPLLPSITHVPFLFFDDSYYSGKTANKVIRYIEESGGRVLCTYVMYDGCPEKNEDVHSLYRYYK